MSTPFAVVARVTVVLHLVPLLVGALLVADLLRQIPPTNSHRRQ